MKLILSIFIGGDDRLVQLFRYGELNQDTILDELNRLKSEREADKVKLESLTAARERVTALENAEIKLSDYCEKLKHNLNSASYQEKWDMLDMLAIKVIATKETIQVDGLIPLEPTSTQTSDQAPDITHHWTNIGMFDRCGRSFKRRAICKYFTVLSS